MLPAGYAMMRWLRVSRAPNAKKAAWSCWALLSTRWMLRASWMVLPVGVAAIVA